MVGNWSEGKMTDGKWLFPNGVSYDGTFEHNKPKGKGTWAFQNGNTQKGEYIQHVLPADEDAEVMRFFGRIFELTNKNRLKKMLLLR